RLGKKEKDKKVILIFFLLLIFLLTGGYWLLHSLQTNSSQNHRMTQLQKDSKATRPDRISRAGNNEDSSFEKFKIKSGNNLTNVDSASISIKKMKSFKANSQNKIVTRNETKQRKFSGNFTSEPNHNFSKRANKEDSLTASSKLIKKTTTAEIENKNESESIVNNFQNQINTDSFLIQLESE